MRAILAIFLERRRGMLLLVASFFAASLVVGGLMAWTLPDAESRLLRNELAHYSLWVGQAPPTNSLPLLHQALRQDLLNSAGLILLAALSLLGMPVILLVVAGRGFVLGFTAGLFAQPLSWSSPLAVAAFLLPHNLLIVPGLVLLAVTGLSLTQTTWRLLAGRRTDVTYGQQLGAASIMAIVTGGMILLGDLLQAFLSPYLLAMASRFWP